MKRFVVASLLTAGLLSLSLAPLTAAETEGPSTNGNFQVLMENGVSRNIQFDARQARDGSTSGEITFQDSGKIANIAKATIDVEVSEELPPFYGKASCDCLVIKGVEAVLGGTIIESNHKNVIGRRVVLTVQDGDSLDPPLRDKLTWGFYRTIAKNWVPTDGERPEEGPAGTWVATDAERTDDVGVISQKSEQVNCESFPISSYSFVGSKSGSGKIEVRR